MSEWGYVSKEGAKQKFEHSPDIAAEMVSKMSSVLLDQEKIIDDLKNQIIDFQAQLLCIRSNEARLEGYIERVREMDGVCEMDGV